ncbi:MAG: hypothetical protein DK304_000524 [Chloroflexi bacterium]|nr:MAG: hypothetical protein DK304_000524 [Chloroflexota bacterium]
MVLGLASVSISVRYANQILESTLAYIETTRRDIQIVDSDVEIIFGV